MEFFNHQFGSSAMSSQSWDAPEISSPSGDSIVRCRSHSDEEVILASNRPKRSAGRKKFRETRHPVYRGVRRRNSDKWVCEVREPNKKTRIWLGTYQTAEMAARAHDVATLALRGRSACLNFADSVWRLPVPESTDAKDIRKAATEAAELFRHEGSDASRMENVKPLEDNENENVFDIDEEAEFGMPGLMASMAEGLLLAPPPPPPPPNVGSEFNWGDDESISDVPLWSFSI